MSNITQKYGLGQPYIAGFVDGEGCLSIYKHQDKRISKGYTFYPKFTICSTNKYTLSLLKRELGGRIFISNKKSNTSKCVYALAIQDLENIENDKNKIYPHLIVKRKRP